MNFTIRTPQPEDCKEVERMIMELAMCVRMPDQVKVSHKELVKDGFGPNPFYHCLIAEVPEEHRSKEGHTTVGYALYYYTYSTWKGRCIYMEDLYIMPEFIVKCIGNALMASVAKVGTEKQCVYLQGCVQEWNTIALSACVSKGAQDITSEEGWHLLRFHGESLVELAEQSN